MIGSRVHDRVPWFATTVTVTVSLVSSAPSLAVSCKSYVPGSLSVAVVTGCVGWAKETEPGPATFDHEDVSWPSGSPSSLTVPCRVTVADVEATSRMPAAPKRRVPHCATCAILETSKARAVPADPPQDARALLGDQEIADHAREARGADAPEVASAEVGAEEVLVGRMTSMSSGAMPIS